MIRYRLIFLLCVLFVSSRVSGFTEDKAAACPMHKQHMDQKERADHADHERHAGVNRRGDHAMGFSHTATTHHFRLTSEGGMIEVGTNDSNDIASRDQIRRHLAQISRMFAEGNFEMPMFIHSEVPPGVPAMKRLASEIAYLFEETENGGRVLIATRNVEALGAIHEFLKFQIKDHQTGDPLEIESDK